MTFPFTLSGYRELIESFLARGYEIKKFADAQVKEAHLILRHDVDMSLDQALEFSRYEAEEGYRATYFVLLCSEFYNAFTAKNIGIISEIAGMGHDIGLHFDASKYGDAKETLTNAARSECAILEDILGRDVSVISFHRPATSLLDYSEPLAGRIHAYQPKFFWEMGYCSDSRGAWEHGEPLNHSVVEERRALQLLTHPIWWTGRALSPKKKLQEFLAETFEHLDLELSKQCKTHQAAGLEVIRTVRR